MWWFLYSHVQWLRRAADTPVSAVAAISIVVGIDLIWWMLVTKPVRTGSSIDIHDWSSSDLEETNLLRVTAYWHDCGMWWHILWSTVTERLMYLPSAHLLHRTCLNGMWKHMWFSQVMEILPLADHHFQRDIVLFQQYSTMHLWSWQVLLSPFTNKGFATTCLS